MATDRQEHAMICHGLACKEKDSCIHHHKKGYKGLEVLRPRYVDGLCQEYTDGKEV